MSNVLSTYRSKDIEPYFKKCAEKCGSERPSDVLRFALKETARDSSPEIISEDMEIDTMSDNEIIKELDKVTKKIKIEKDVGALGGDMWQEFLRRASNKKVGPSAFMKEVKTVIRAVMLQAAHEGVGANNYLLNSFDDHYRAGQSKNERLEIVDVKRGKNFRGGNAKNVCTYDEKGQKILISRDEYERDYI